MPPSIISWNLTRLCNERCRHCYLDAGPTADRSDELSTAECLDVLRQLHDLAPGALLIFTGGEPLLRADLYDLARAARDLGFTPVVGTNGIRLTPERIARLMEAGVQGVALSLDSMRPDVHDAFRGRAGAWRATVASLPHLREAGLPFVLQTTVSLANLTELPRLIAFAAEQGAQVHNLYFLVPSGRGASFTSDLTPQQYETLLADIARWQQDCPGLLLGVKCAPHYQRLLYQQNPDSPYLRAFDEEAGGCPAGIQYLGIRPNGDVTPCPYLPVYGGNLRDTPLREIWEDSPVFRQARARGELAARCGACEFNRLCGGCRARAWTVNGNLLAEDPLCAYQPEERGVPQAQPRAVYGGVQVSGIPWTEDARRRAEALPAFIRPMVCKGVERYAREQGLERITVEVMHRARQALVGEKGLRMPDFVRRKLEAEGKIRADEP
ncbi:MAG: heme b synthase [Anaerolineales bacterium]